MPAREPAADTKRPIPLTRFSTALLPPGEALDIWRDSMAAVFDVSVKADQPERFEADLTTWNLGEMLVSRTFIGAQTFDRGRQKLRRDDIDHFLVQLYSAGGYQGIVGENSIDLKPGEVSILDLSRVTSTEALTSSTTTLVIPRDVLGEALSLNGLHGTVVGGACGKLLASHLRGLVEHLPVSTIDEAPSISRGTIQMIAAMAAPSRSTLHEASEPIGMTVKARARHHIDRHLGKAELTPDRLCAALGVTRATMYRIFEPHGGVASFILERRLNRVQRALRDPLDRRRIGDIAAAFGFGNPITFSRAFKRNLGITPGEYREQAMRTDAFSDWTQAQASEVAPRFDVWLRSLRKD